MTVKSKNTPEINITSDCYNKIMCYAKIADEEISGLGFINDDGLIYDVVLFEQKCTGAETDLNMDDVNAYFFKLIEEDEEKIKDLRVWWHSHVNMATTWSKTDDDTIADLMNDINDLVSIVVNKKESVRCRNDIKFRDNILTFDDITLVKVDEELERMKAESKVIMEDTCKKLHETFPRIKKFTVSFEDEKIAFVPTISNELPESFTKQLEAEVKEKVKDSKYNHAKQFEVINNKKDRITGYSKALKHDIFFDTVEYKYYYMIGVRNNLTKSYLSQNEIKRRLEEIMEPEDENATKDFPYTPSELKKIVKRDSEGIQSKTIYNNTPFLYYSKLRGIFKALDVAKTNAEINKIADKVGLRDTTRVSALNLEYINRSILANEIIEMLKTNFDIKSTEIVEFIELLDLKKLMLNEFGRFTYINREYTS